MKHRLFAALLLSMLLAGCAAPVVLGVSGVAAGVALANDRRTAGVMLDDERIELNTLELVAGDTVLRNNGHVNATSYNGLLLLTGEVPDQASSDALERYAARLERVRLVHNALRIGAVSDTASRTADTRTTSRVKSRLISELPAGLGHHIKVITESDTVYLMGLVSRDEAAQAVEMTRHTVGVQRIVKVFEYQS